MKRIAILFLLLCPMASGMIIENGSTDVTTYFVLRTAADGTATTGATITSIDLQYVEQGAVPSAKADATALGATNSAHGDNQAIEIDATDQPGLYRVDWPDAAFDGGIGKTVILSVKLASSFTEHMMVELSPPVNAVAWNDTALPADVQAGYPTVTIKDGTGTGEINTASGAVVSVTTTGTASAVTAVSAGGITASSIAADAIGASELAADAIGASELATDAIGAAEIAADAITSAEIANDAIGATEIATGAVDADAIAADAIGASEIATDAIGAAEIAADAIGASEIATDALTATEIAADAIGAAEAGFLTDSTGFQGADVAAILTDTGVIGAAGVGLTAVALADATSDAVMADAIWNALKASYGTANTYGEHVESLSAGGDATEAKQDSIIATLGTPANIDSGGATIAGNLKKIADDNAGATFDATNHSLYAIRVQGDSAWITGGAGGGAITFTYTLTDDVSSDPIADVLVWATTDVGGTNTIGSTRTDNFGEAVFTLDAGTYYMWRKKGGYQFTNPDSQVVN